MQTSLKSLSGALSALGNLQLRRHFKICVIISNTSALATEPGGSLGLVASRPGFPKRDARVDAHLPPTSATEPAPQPWAGRRWEGAPHLSPRAHLLAPRPAQAAFPSAAQSGSARRSLASRLLRHSRGGRRGLGAGVALPRAGPSLSPRSCELPPPGPGHRRVGVAPRASPPVRPRGDEDCGGGGGERGEPGFREGRHTRCSLRSRGSAGDVLNNLLIIQSDSARDARPRALPSPRRPLYNLFCKNIYTHGRAAAEGAPARPTLVAPAAPALTRRPPRRRTG